MKCTEAMLDITDLWASYGSAAVLRGLSLRIQRNERWAIIGRNGTGKSTLIKLVAGLLNPEQGIIRVDGTDVKRYSSKKRAQVMAYVPQKLDGIIPYSVHDFIMLGRYNSMGLLGVPSPKDYEAVREAIDICGIRHIVGRLMSTLSGGELQRVLLAGAVAQQTPLLLLDEPTTFLDPAHECLFFDALARLHKQRELTIVMVTHDINTAIAQCTHVGALLDGSFIFTGTSREFASRCPVLLDEIFSVSFERYTCSSRNAEAFGAWGVPCL
jgi:ABC-type cobalamin/Fe3+-siderophores transport system ATPase subunit